MAVNRLSVLVFGGSGFVGSHVVAALKQAGHIPVVVSRSDNAAVKGSLEEPEGILSNLQHKPDAIIYCVGLLSQTKTQTYQDFHVNYLKNALRIADKTGVSRFILISANGIEESQAQYAKTKLAGEKLVKNSNLDWTIIRPSLVLGTGPNFNFAKLLDLQTRFLVAPVPSAKALIQPVAATDLGQAVAKVLTEKQATRQTYPVCGPVVYKLKDLIKDYAGLKHRFVITLPVPLFLAALVSPVLRLLGLPASTEQLQMLEKGNTSIDKSIWELLKTSPRNAFSDLK